MNFFHSKGNALAIITVVAFGLGLLLLLPPAEAGPALQPPRPTIPATIPGGPPGGGPGEGGEPGRLPGTTIHGWVVNWNYHNEPHARIRLRGGGWTLETNSDDNGYYYFKGLGIDNIFLNLVLPEGSGLTPITTDLALRTQGAGQIVVNLGFYPAGPVTSPGLPVDISMSVKPESARQGETVLYTIHVTNRLPHRISQVLVTDYLPESLVPVRAAVSSIRVTPTPTETPVPVTPTPTPLPGPPTATPGPWPPAPTPLPSPVEIWGNLVIADIGEMAVGEMAVVTIEARIDDRAAPGAVIQNRASCLYAESIAVQAMTPLTISGTGPTSVPATEALAVVAMATVETPAPEGTPTLTATPGPPGRLPVTGFSLPIAGVLFALLVLIARLLRPQPVDKTQ